MPARWCRADEVPALVARQRQRFGGAWFAERFIDGREFNLPLLEGEDGPELLPLGEMEFLDFAGRRAADHRLRREVGSDLVRLSQHAAHLRARARATGRCGSG